MSQLLQVGGQVDVRARLRSEQIEETYRFSIHSQYKPSSQPGCRLCEPSAEDACLLGRHIQTVRFAAFYRV